MDNLGDKYKIYHNYLNNKSSNQTPSEKATIKRKSLLHTYQASLNLLDNDSTLLLLEDDLADYSEFISEQTSNLYQNKPSSNVNTNKGKIHSTLDKSKILKMLKPLPCSENGGLTCTKSETVSNEEFQQFISRVKQNTSVNNEREYKTQNTVIDNKPKFKSFGGRCFAPRGTRGFNPPARINDIPEPSNSFRRFNSNDTFSSTEDNSRDNFRTNTRDDIYQPQEKEQRPTLYFKSASEELQIQNIKRHGSGGNLGNTGGQKRKLVISGGGKSKFVAPMLSNKQNEEIDERLRNIDPKMVELITSEIMDNGTPVDWDDIAGLDFAKTAIKEAVVLPMLRPDIFTGLRRPPKGILLFGPPGTGKTLIGKCVASQSKSTFFCISASSLTSKWIGDGEKMVRALFAVARVHQPSVIFIDEIDSMLTQRNETEHESSRRMKTEFLVQLDGASTENEERLLIIGATNRPQELDEAARRRFVRRLYIPLPEIEARLQLVRKLMSSERNVLCEDDLLEIAETAEGYSGADVRILCSEASMGPIRSMDLSRIHSIQAAEVPPVSMEDFTKAFQRVRSSVSPKDLDQYTQWDNTYGSGVGM